MKNFLGLALLALTMLLMPDSVGGTLMAIPLLPIGIGIGSAVAGQLFGGGPAEETSTSQFTGAARRFSDQLLGRAANVGFVPGQRGIAGLDPAELEAFQRAQQQFGGAAGALGFGQNLLQGLAGQDIGAGISQFFNPFQEEVIGGLEGDFQRQRAQTLQGIGTGATRAGAFGGTRQALAEGTALGELGRQQGNVLAGVRQGGFQNAVQQFLANQQFQGGLGQALAGIGFRGAEGQFGAGLGLGQTRRGIEQAGFDAEREEALRKQQFQFDRLGAGTNVLRGATPGSLRRTTRGAEGNPFAQFLGDFTTGFGFGQSF